MTCASALETSDRLTDDWYLFLCLHCHKIPFADQDSSQMNQGVAFIVLERELNNIHSYIVSVCLECPARFPSHNPIIQGKRDSDVYGLCILFKEKNKNF